MRKSKSKASSNDEEIRRPMGKNHRLVMLKTVNPAYQPMNFFTEISIGSFGSENEMFTYDQDYAEEKLSGVGIPWETHEPMKSIYEKENVI